MAMIDPNAASAQDASPSWATRLALLFTFAASFAAVLQAGLISPPMFFGLIVLICVAQVVGHPYLLGEWIARLPTMVIALGFVMLAVYVTLQFGFAAGGAVWCAALFMLCVDWSTLGKLPLPLLLTLLLVTVSLTRGRLDHVVPMLGVWTVGLVATLVLMERDASVGGKRLEVREQVARSRHGRPAMEIAVVALLLVLIVPLIGLLIPNPTQGRPNRLGDVFSNQKQSTPYWGFQDELDTSTRGKLDDEIVMRVQADAPDYWRGTSFDQWDGRRWKKSESSESRYPGFGTVNVRPGPTDVQGGKPFRQVFTVEKSGSDLVFGAYRMSEVELAESATVDRADGTVRTFAPLSPGSVYTVISRRQDVTSARLRQADPLRKGIPKEISDTYLGLPDTTAERVKQLGRDVTQGESTTYDKVMAVGAWMRANTEYSQDVPPLPDGADGAEQHLFVDKQGDCDQIATSSAVMLRSVGIPTRLAVGFIPGDRNAFTGEYTVRADDAHAWIEVWFPDVGWQAFDPTTDVPLAGEYQASTLDDFMGLLRALLPWIALVGALVLLVVIGVFVRNRTRDARSRRHQPWAAQACQRVLRAGTERGRSRQAHESLIEYTTALSNDVLPDERVAGVGRLVSRSLFSNHDATEEEQRWAEAVMDEVEKANPPRELRRQRRRDAKDARRTARADARAALTAARAQARASRMNPRPADTTGAPSQSADTT